MRVYFIPILIFILSFKISASTCIERVSKKYNEEFHSHLSLIFKNDSNLELYKSTLFKPSASQHGLKMTLNLGIKNQTSDESYKRFTSAVDEFIQQRASLGLSFGREGDRYQYFYLSQIDLPCTDKSFFLEGSSRDCASNVDSFENSTIGDLASAVSSIGEHIPQLEIIEIDPNPLSLKKNIKVLIKESLINNDETSLSVTGGSCDMGPDLKRDFSCTISGGDSMKVNLRVGDLEDSLSFDGSRSTGYLLKGIENSSNDFQVVKLTENEGTQVLEASEFEITDGPCTLGGSNNIKCSTQEDSSFRLSVVPEKNERETLSLDVASPNAFTLNVKSDEDGQHKIVSAHVFRNGKEDFSEISKVAVEAHENCEIISQLNKIFKCKKMPTPYSVKAVYLGVDIIKKSVLIGEFSKYSLVLESKGDNSLDQTHNINIYGDGVKIPPSSYDDLGLSVGLKDVSGHRVSYLKDEGKAVAEKEGSSFTYQVELLHKNKVSDSKRVAVKEYYSGDNYFFDIIKKNRQCHFKLMKVQGTEDFKSVGQEEFLKNAMDVEVTSKRNSCSGVQKSQNGIQVFCSLRKDKIEEYVTAQLIVDGKKVRSVKCHLLNEDYYEEDDDDDEKEERISSSAKRSSSSSKSKMVEDIGDTFSQAFPQFLQARYPTTTQTQIYNPLMYSGYSPYNTNMFAPGYYQSQGLWNTMYMFNPATY